MSFSQIQAPQPTQIPRNYLEASEKDADFLQLKLLNKRVRLRISPDPLVFNAEQARYSLFTVGNFCGWFAAVIRSGNESAIALAPLLNLRTSLLTSTAESGEVPFNPQRVLPLPPGTDATHVIFAFNDSRFLVALRQGPILVYDSSQVLSSGSGILEPLQTIQSESTQSVQQLLPNPGDLPNLVAVRRGNVFGEAVVEVIDVGQSIQVIAGWKSGNTPDTVPATISWSPKGKQISIGLFSGDILTYSPSQPSTVKIHISKPPQAQNLTVISAIWLANPTFHAIYTSPDSALSPEADQSHYIVTQEPKAPTANSDVKLSTPYFSSPGLRPPGAMSVVLRNWDPARCLIFIGDGPSSDIGVIGSITDASTNQDTWSNLTLEETFTPSLPLDLESNDTILFGLELDLTNNVAVKATPGGGGEEQEFPAPPVLMAYVSDGTVQVWYVINTSTKGGMYPGMAAASATGAISMAMSISGSGNDTAMNVPSTPKPAFATIPATSPFQNAQPSIGINSFGQQPTPVFGSTTFGQTQAPAFGQTSPFGQNNKSPSHFANSATTNAFASGSQKPAGGGFGAFATQAPAKFGSTGFGFGSGSSNISNNPPPTVAAAPETDMEEQSSAPPTEMSDGSSGFGGLSLGSGTNDKQQPSKTSIFGSFAAPSQTVNKTPAFGSTGFGDTNSGAGSMFKPASGFGAFSGFSNQNNTASSSIGASVDLAKKSAASPAFGQSSLGQPSAASAFGQNSFGKSAFGQTSFGTPSFGTTSTPSGNSASALGGNAGVKGGFGAFAGGGFSAFGSSNATASTTNVSAPFAATSNSATGEAISGPKPTSPFATTTATPDNVVNKPSTPPSALLTPQASTSAIHSTSSIPSPNSSPEGSPRFGSFAKNRPVLPDSPTEDSPHPLSGFDTPKVSGKLQFSSKSPSPEAVGKSSAFGTKTDATSPKPNIVNTSESSFKPSAGFGAFGGSPQPSKSPFKSTTPVGGGFGAFSGLKSTPNAFGTTGGATFGAAFSPSPTADKSKPKESVFGGAKSAFGPGGTGPASGSVTGAGTPVFGSTSFPGSDSPTFGKPSVHSPSSSAKVVSSPTVATKTTSAFGAFAGSSGSFASLSASSAGTTSNSFSELLRQKGDGSKKDEESKAPKPQKERSSDESDYVTVEKGGIEDLTASVQRPDNVQSPEASEDEDALHEDEDDLAQYDDDATSFISASVSGESDDDVEDETLDHETATYPAKEEASSSTDIKSPANAEPRSPTGSPVLDENGNKKKTSTTSIFGDTTGKMSPESTTPPGSPHKFSSSPIAAPKPTVPSSATNALGLGRPATRPNRSSPLASTPLSGDEDASENPPSSTPLAIPKARPASPRKPFGQVFSDTQKNEAYKTKSTPPFGSTTPSPGVTQSLGKQPLFGRVSPLQSSTPSIFPPLQSPASPSLPPLSMPSLFSTPIGEKSNAKVSTPMAAPFQNSSASSIAKSESGKLSSTPFGQNKTFAFGNTTTPATPMLSPSPVDNEKPSVRSTPFAFGPQTQTPMVSQQVKTSQASVQGSGKSGLQVQLEALYQNMTDELEQLKRAAQEATAIRNRLARSTSSMSLTKADLADSSKWTFGDIAAFGKALRSVEEDVLQLRQYKANLLQSIKEIESNQLKIETRMEEIKRFSKAKDDPEFASMLKSRTLGPENAEIQNNLRRKLRIVMSRLEQLEDRIQICKKRLHEHQTGKPKFKAPALDTVDRAYRNIDIAISQRTDLITSLTERLEKLNMNSERRQSSSCQVDDISFSDYPELAQQNNLEVSPHIAASAADALNAERNARRLKLAFSKMNWKPRVNVQAKDLMAFAPKLDTSTRLGSINRAGRPLPPTTPHNKSTPTPAQSSPEVYPAPSDQKTSIGGNTLFGLNKLTSELATSIPESHSIRRNERSTKHTKPVALKKSPQSAPINISSFDWGPVPALKPISSLSFMAPDGGKKDLA